VRGFGTVTLCIRDDAEFNEAEKRLTFWQSEGLIKVSFRRIEGSCPAVYAKVALTDAGKKYLVRASDGKFEVRAFTLAFGDVTGVQSQERDRTARAEYTLQLHEPTPFAGIVSRAPIKGSASFSLYDDGWRIQPAELQFAPIRWQDVPETSALQQARSEIADAEHQVEEAHRQAEATAERVRSAEAEFLARPAADRLRVLVKAGAVFTGTQHNTSREVPYLNFVLSIQKVDLDAGTVTANNQWLVMRTGDYGRANRVTGTISGDVLTLTETVASDDTGVVDRPYALTFSVRPQSGNNRLFGTWRDSSNREGEAWFDPK